MAIFNKQYRYQILDYTGNFLTEWTDVISDPNFSWEINNGPADLIVKLARPFSSFGEGIDIAFENKLNLYVIDREAPTSKLIYTGRLNEIRPHFGKDGEWVEVQFIGYASTLNDQIARDRTVVDYTTPSTDTGNKVITLPFWYGPGSPSVTSNITSVLACSFPPDVSNISGIGITISGAVANPEPVTVGIMYADNSSYNNALPMFQPGNVIASGVIPATNIPNTLTSMHVSFANTMYNIDSKKLLFGFIAGSGIGVRLANTTGIGAIVPQVLNQDVWMRQTLGGAENRADFVDARSKNSGGFNAGFLENIDMLSTFDTSAPLYNNADPTSVAQDLVKNRYNGPLVFDSTNSPLTGLSITYQFNRQTYKAALDRLTEMAPPYWYYIVKPDNTLQFIPRNDAVLDHVLTLGQHIIEAQPIHSVNELQTRVTLYGGSLPGSAELVYTDDHSWMQPRYTLKEHIVRDSRVRKPSTARQFTRDYLDYYGNPSTMMTVTVQDSNGDYAYGYDIESFVPGQRVLVVDPRADGAKNYQGTSDNVNLDGDLLDSFDNYILAAPLQIMKIEYQPDMAILTLANRPITAPRKIDDVSQNLIQTQMANSPII